MASLGGVCGLGVRADADDPTKEAIFKTTPHKGFPLELHLKVTQG